MRTKKIKQEKISRKNRPKALVLRSSTLLWVSADGSYGGGNLALLDLSKLTYEAHNHLLELLDENADSDRLDIVLDYAESLGGKVTTLAGGM